MSNTYRPRSSAALSIGASLGVALGLVLVGPGCDGPRRDAGTISISESKKVAAEKGNPRAEGGAMGGAGGADAPGQDVSRGGR